MKHIDIKEFRELGFLQEANRLFFHLHGLALEVTVEDDGSEHLSGVWDYRDDPEGIAFGSADYGNSAERAETVAAERAKHADYRKKWFGVDSDIEPLGWHYTDVESALPPKAEEVRG